MKFLSLFSGIGGFDLGLERAGMQCAGQVEINKYCQKILKKHWPGVKLIGDIRDVKGDEFGTVELICGGFPCQPFSCAGKRLGKKDDRYLWPEMLRVIKAYRPSWIICENVVGIVNMELDQVLSDLETEGYATQPFIIPACAVDAPHKRDRVWIFSNSFRNRWDKGRREHGSEEEKRKSYRGYSQRFCSDVSESNGERLQNKWDKKPTEQIRPIDSYRWPSEPGVCRVVNGVPKRVDRLKGLGNAIVPQIAEIIGSFIIETENLFRKEIDHE